MKLFFGLVVTVLIASGCTDDAQVGQQPLTAMAGNRFDYQIGGSYTPAPGVTAVVRDYTDNPADGIWSGCYVNAFQSQPDSEPSEETLLHDARGNRVEDENWPGEYLFDVSAAKRDQVVEMVNAWTDECASKGFDGIEFDNLDSYTRSNGLLSPDDARETAKLLIDHAHSKGLKVGQKNAVDLIEPKLGFDFAITEQCAVYDECNAFTGAFDVVFDIEYTKDGLERACKTETESLSVVFRDLELSTPDKDSYVARWCN